MSITLILPAEVADLLREPGEMVVRTETQINWLSPERLKTDHTISLSCFLANVQSRARYQTWQV